MRNVAKKNPTFHDAVEALLDELDELDPPTARVKKEVAPGLNYEPSSVVQLQA